MKIDVVYKLGTGSKLNDLELRYSLRSLSFFSDLGNIWIVGHKPDWVRNVVHIHSADPFSNNKDANLINKIILISQQNGITDHFLNFSDDQLLLKTCSYKDFIVPLFDNNMINFKENEKLTRWRTRLKNTINTLKVMNLPANCYETHIPTLINKYDYTSTLFQYPYPEGQGMCGNTLYFNTLQLDSKEVPSNFATRIEGVVMDKKVLIDACDGRLHFNYSEQATNNILLEFLAGKFPNKSIYEND